MQTGQQMVNLLTSKLTDGLEKHVTSRYMANIAELRMLVFSDLYSAVYAPLEILIKTFFFEKGSSQSSDFNRIFSYFKSPSSPSLDSFSCEEFKSPVGFHMSCSFLNQSVEDFGFLAVTQHFRLDRCATSASTPSDCNVLSKLR